MLTTEGMWFTVNNVRISKVGKITENYSVQLVLILSKMKALCCVSAFIKMKRLLSPAHFAVDTHKIRVSDACLD